ncbi:tripartite tricarboxylate transporter permease [Desulfovibrio sp. OttesenSCG-928-C06]|nr:tripartite tricarboxylate transporter permease [Desulfovibrio sp. OttesenSCG-928-C06]
MQDIILGLGDALSLINIFFVSCGIVMGLVIGAIPGLNGPMGIALCIPLTYYMSPVTAIGFLVGINKGTGFGGAISAILLNTPGTPEAAATALDGYPMAQNGKGEKALRMALYSSVFGDTFSDIVLVLVAAPLAMVALYMGPPEIFAVVALAMTVIAGLESSSLGKGLITASFGILISCIGVDTVTALPRLSMGLYQLENGISLVVIGIGMLAVAEVLLQLEIHVKEGLACMVFSKNPEDRYLRWWEFKSVLRTLVRSSCIGTWVGAMPGIGAPVAAFIAYNEARKKSKNPEEFGKGSLEGLAAPEAAYSAVCGSNLIPLFTLGIPGNLAAALLIGAFVLHGVTPGPLMFEQNGRMIYGIYGSMLIANFLNLGIGRVGMKAFCKVVQVPKVILYPVILFICMMGAYMADSSIFGVQVMLVFGIVGYLMKKFNYSYVCFIIGFILGPMFELSLQQIVIRSAQEPGFMFTRPVALALLALTAFIVLRTIYRAIKNR